MMTPVVCLACRRRAERLLGGVILLTHDPACPTLIARQRARPRTRWRKLGDGAWAHEVQARRGQLWEHVGVAYRQPSGYWRGEPPGGGEPTLAVATRWAVGGQLVKLWQAAANPGA